MFESIQSVTRRMIQDYPSNTAKISDYVEYNQYKLINEIEAYAFSKHHSGEVDALGREKPFFNLVTAAENIWYRATNIVRQKIRVKAQKNQLKPLALAMTMLIQNWMEKTNFDSFLQKWGRTLARYGSAVPKWMKKNGELEVSVEQWNKLVTDLLDFNANPKIVKMDMTPAQLKKNKNYNQEAVKNLLSSVAKSRKDLNNQEKDDSNGYIQVYEVHGEFSEAQYWAAKGKDYTKEQENIYFQQLHVLAFDSNKEDSNENTEFILYSGKEEDPYYITHLIEEDSRTMAIGSIEYSFQSQWMTNHGAKLMKDQLDMASDLFFQTADPNYLGRNLFNIISGDILIHEEGKPLTPVNNRTHDISAIQNFINTWQVASKEITSTPDALRANTQPAGTAFRSVLAQQQQGLSLFEVMKQNKKTQLAAMIKRFLIPHLLTKMDTSEEISAILESQDITQLDMMYVPKEAVKRHNEIIKKQILNGEIANTLDLKEIEQGVRKELEPLGSQRFIKPSDISTKTWKGLIGEFIDDMEIEIIDKETDDTLMAQTLVDLFKTLSNPAIQQFITTPQGKLLWNKTLESTKAVSPLEISQTPIELSPQLSQQVAQ